MRLLNVHSMQLEEFFENEIPPYAILSHRWGREEVTFQDMKDEAKAAKKAGYTKITGCCQLATSDSYDYFWIDTCCIGMEGRRDDVEWCLLTCR